MLHVVNMWGLTASADSYSVSRHIWLLIRLPSPVFSRCVHIIRSAWLTCLTLNLISWSSRPMSFSRWYSHAPVALTSTVCLINLPHLISDRASVRLDSQHVTHSFFNTRCHSHCSGYYGNHRYRYEDKDCLFHITHTYSNSQRWERNGQHASWSNYDNTQKSYTVWHGITRQSSENQYWSKIWRWRQQRWQHTKIRSQEDKYKAHKMKKPRNWRHRKSASWAKSSKTAAKVLKSESAD